MNFKITKAEHGQFLYLGRRGERFVRCVQFDLSHWMETYGSGRVELSVQRSGENSPYPVALELSGSIASWILSDVDTAVAGNGKCRLTYFVGDGIAHSRTWTTIVENTLADPVGDPPEREKAWVDEVLAVGAASKQNAEDAAKSAALAEQAANDVKPELAAYLNAAERAAEASAASAQRAKESEDKAPTAVVSKSGNVATITVTDKNGSSTVEISDGSVTGQSISEALGYIPADAKKVSDLEITLGESEHRASESISEISDEVFRVGLSENIRDTVPTRQVYRKIYAFEFVKGESYKVHLDKHGKFADVESIVIGTINEENTYASIDDLIERIGSIGGKTESGDFHFIPTTGAKFVIVLMTVNPTELEIDLTIRRNPIIQACDEIENLKNTDTDIRERITSFEDRVFQRPINLIDKRVINMGGYTNADGKLTLTTNSSWCCVLVPIEYGKKYSVTRNDYMAHCVKEDQETIVGKFEKNVLLFDTAKFSQEFKYIAFTWHGGKDDEVMFVEGDTLPDHYVEYNGNTLNKDVSVLLENLDIGDVLTESIFKIVTKAKSDHTEHVISVVDAYKYPLTPTWGNEYLASWYNKLFDNSAKLTIDLEGDSITAGGFYNTSIANMMRVAGYSSDKYQIINNGKSSRATGEWVGTGDYYSVETDKTQYPNGILDVGMSNNADLMICAYGGNDAVRGVGTLTVEERVALFETNMTEALKRIRGNTPINDRPCYNKSAEELAVILCVPTTAWIGGTEPKRLARDYKNWHTFIRPIIQKLCREYQCAFADYAMMGYDNSWSVNNIWGWQGHTPTLHPNEAYQRNYSSILQNLIVPIGLWK